MFRERGFNTLALPCCLSSELACSVHLLLQTKLSEFCKQAHTRDMLQHHVSASRYAHLVLPFK